MAGEFEDLEATDDELRLARLSASSALLNPDRVNNRQDVLISSLLAVLSKRGDLAKDKLFTAVTRMWRTTAIAESILDDALTRSRAASLIVEQVTFDDTKLYRISDAARADMAVDEKVVANLLRTFAEEIEDRLSEYTEAERLRKKIPRITDLVITAIAQATRGVYSIESPASTILTRPTVIKLKAIHDFTRDLEPRSHREPVHALALAALDPSDAFGNEVVHLIIVGSLLHGIAAQRGPSDPALGGCMVLLDTSFLVDIVLPTFDPGRKLFDQIINLSKRCDASLVVARHTLDEWERVWDAADRQFKGHETRDTSHLPSTLSRLVGNPFLAAYLANQEDGASKSWVAWQEHRRPLEPTLLSLGIEIVDFEPTGDDERQLHQSILDKLMELSNDGKSRRSRTQTAAEADAKSASLIQRWRAAGPDSAVFLAKDKLTDEAFRSVTEEGASLTAEPHSWLLYTSHLLQENCESVIESADLIADVLVRDTLLTMASSRSLEEVLDIAEVLSDGGAFASARLVRDLDDPTLFESLDALSSSASADPKAQAAAVLLRQAKRHDQRATNRESLFDQELDNVKKKSNLDLEQFRGIANDKTEAERKSKEAAIGRATEGERSAIVATRERNAVGAVGLATFSVTLLSSWGFLTGIALMAGVATVVLGAIYAYRWTGNPDQKTSDLALSLLAQTMFEILASVFL